jgi:hypothetical protein
MVESATFRNQFTCNGTGPYPITLGVGLDGTGNAENIAAKITNASTGAWVADLTLSSGLTTTGMNAYTTSSYDSNYEITLYHSMTFTQLRDLAQEGTVTLETLEDIIDGIYRHLIQLKDATDRSPAYPEYDEDLSMVMPIATERASKILGFNAEGEPIACELTVNSFTVTDYAKTLMDDANAATARTTLDVYSEAEVDALLDLSAYDAVTIPDDTDIMLIQESSDDKEKLTLDNLATYVMGKVFPIGFIYVQFPGKDDPDTLGWPGVWENVSDEYPGDFFRAEGGDASAFESGQQADAFQGHHHQLKYENQFTWPGNGTDVYRFRYASNDIPYDLVQDPITDGSNGTPRTATETRPKNRTIRIWERTS